MAINNIKREKGIEYSPRMVMGRKNAAKQGIIHWIQRWVFFKNSRSARPKILANSIPKAGTNLLLEVFKNMEGLQNANRGVDFLMSFSEIKASLRELREGEYLYGHLYYDQEIGSFLKQFSVSHVLIVRDPRDVAVSLAFYVKTRSSNRLHEYFRGLNSDMERILCSIQGVPDNVLAGKTGLLSLAERYRRFSPWLKDERCLIIRFEDLIGRQGRGDREKQLKTIKCISQHIGIPLKEDQIQNIANGLFNKLSPTFRAGNIGGWKEYLDPMMMAKLEADKAIYRAYGYEL